ncbi:PD-(D/E)XK nuclease family protein [Pseudenhygromyxa sp. WMMC2535]|uniref:PD-(D/E)XK nuclease family protein n=1 Tax=Pseudenhygromyxa sp. WMMC2535 TaxID=2712867 RepID=UPI0015516995|nr:PD-(D/E)XK nuclease family protein [Pseudenhygromyxa sp. WMMC2535]NVB38480.1 PD-(D/E)XK nuclease family protein [Pseudenhygromyxa sp. WMMC2535]
MPDLVERLLARVRRHSPGRVLVVVRGRHEARWIQSLMAAHGPVVGARILDLEALLDEAARALGGEPLSRLETLAEVRAALAGDPDQRFELILDQPSYQREVLRTFTELERATAGASVGGEGEGELEAQLERAQGARDQAMLAAFLRFRREMRTRERDALRPLWWRGQALAKVLAGHARVSFLRHNSARLALGFFSGTTAVWETRLLEALDFERWDGALTEGLLAAGAARDRHPLSMRLSCAGPEAEIAGVARILRGHPRWAARSGQPGSPPAAVLAPEQDVPRWVARLRHRDIPVRAWVEQRAGDTAAARTVRALLRVTLGAGLLGSEGGSSSSSSSDRGASVVQAGGAAARELAVTRADLDAVLFGPALRAWGALAEDLDVDFPRAPTPGDLRDAWESQRAASLTLDTLSTRLRAAGERGDEALRERAERFEWPAEQLEARQRRLADAHRLLAAAIERLQAVDGPEQLRTLLDDWDLLGRAAVHGVDGPEMTAARVVFEVLAGAAALDSPGLDVDQPGARPDPLGARLDHALSFAHAGRWVESRSSFAPASGEHAVVEPVEPPPAVWVMPYACAATLDHLPERLILAGLDVHPHPPVHHGPISTQLRGDLGLIPDATRFSAELRLLDLLTDGQREVIASWRHRDGAGNRRPPGPWIAGRQGGAAVEWQVGVDALAVDEETGTAEVPRAAAPIEAALLGWAGLPELARRVEAMQAHEGAAVSAHTGDLGVAVPPARPYSASALQSYAALPYRYFIERVLGLRERLGDPSGASALLAAEQGQVVHRALDAALRPRLDALETGWLELASISEALLADALAALTEGYRKRAEHGQSEVIWTSERDRWATELSVWWQTWHQRLAADWSGVVKPSAASSNSSAKSAKSRAKAAWRKAEPEQTAPGLFLAAAEWSLDAGEGFELELDGQKIPFTGVIDRLEVDPPRNRLIVCDYKTGTPPSSSKLSAELRAGTHLQLPLYALAVEQICRDAPARLRMHGPTRVGALRLEYLRRPPRFRKGEPVPPEARGFDPHGPLGIDDQGEEQTVIAAAARFAAAFCAAIAAGRFPLVARAPRSKGAPGAGGRLHELMRAIPAADERACGLPPALHLLADSRRAREVVR